ncbi:hypothetical protein BSKO_12191 [Bryopsis sp. KO-2023]|nr:hypothetical protein BSKO_12191 [Bryopsis sp. KO-2023]
MDEFQEGGDTEGPSRRQKRTRGSETETEAGEEAEAELPIRRRGLTGKEPSRRRKRARKDTRPHQPRRTPDTPCITPAACIFCKKGESDRPGGGSFNGMAVKFCDAHIVCENALCRDKFWLTQTLEVTPTKTVRRAFFPEAMAAPRIGVHEPPGGSARGGSARGGSAGGGGGGTGRSAGGGGSARGRSAGGGGGGTGRSAGGGGSARGRSAGGGGGGTGRSAGGGGGGRRERLPPPGENARSAMTGLSAVDGDTDGRGGGFRLLASLV